ncbi:FtsQ-type POTRA domain-containing protein [Tumidithrix elongata RA019]|uniref:FtsQ-type POTRA domain-containing protein n=1 Tax=Tumidithrix elongata BACA0141 TaxID=2716417 RepID=A0AAW9Q5Q8_9CYAN|nr:FtsQ-type POTRA domain-containing protein [Tumidithrix elongata RA019]
MNIKEEISIPAIARHHSDFAERRKSLRKDRRIKLIQRLWQLTFITGVTGGLLWLATLPEWQLRNANQIDIEGNHLLSKETIKRQLQISYPQSIFQVQPETIAAQLENSAPVQNVVVTRTVFPSRLTIKVQERSPVAIATRNGKTGFLDEGGKWMPLQVYPSSVTKPELTILEASDRPISQAQWSVLYRQVSQSPVKISQIDGRDESNLILTTEFAVAHLGPYQSKLFAEQLAYLDKMRNLPKKQPLKEPAYVDLRDLGNVVLNHPSQPKPKDNKSS